MEKRALLVNRRGLGRRQSLREIDASAIQTILDTSPPTMRSSMLKDLIGGRELELDAIGGPIARGGEKYGIATPITRKLIEEISELEPRSLKLKT